MQKQHFNKRPSIRLAQESDVPEILQIYAPHIQQSATSFELEVPSQDEFWQRIQDILTHSPWLVCAQQHEIMGYAYASAHRSRQAYQWTREVSVYIHASHFGKGIGTALYVALLELLKLQGYATALAGIVQPNPASVHFHKNLDFRQIGIYHQVGYKFGKYWDVAWWELPLRTEPAESILALEAIKNTSAWKVAVEKGIRMMKI